MSLKIIFAGTPVFAEKSLASLYHSEHQVIAVYTQPDKPAGRGKKITMSPVKQFALQHNIPVFQPKTLRAPEAQAQLRELQADVMVVAAYGLILPEAVLSIPKYGCINVHGSLLPRWRGAAPVQHAILAGDNETGITIMQMDKGLDTGDMLLKEAVEITPEETGGGLHDKLAALGAKMIVEAMDDLEANQLTPQKQDDALANYANKIEKQHAQINWHDTASQIERMIRAYHPWPVAYTSLSDIVVKVHQACLSDQTSAEKPGTIIAHTKQGFIVATRMGCLEILTMQLPGKKAMSVKDILNAKAELFSVGKVFNQ